MLFFNKQDKRINRESSEKNLERLVQAMEKGQSRKEHGKHLEHSTADEGHKYGGGTKLSTMFLS